LLEGELLVDGLAQRWSRDPAAASDLQTTLALQRSYGVEYLVEDGLVTLWRPECSTLRLARHPPGRASRRHVYQAIDKTRTAVAEKRHRPSILNALVLACRERRFEVIYFAKTNGRYAEGGSQVRS
jgi:hypothetical protein